MKDLQKCLAEVFGTALLLIFGVGTAVILGLIGATDVLTIAAAFGIAIIAAFYSIGHISGAHLNPAVSLAAFCAGRMKFVEMLKYMLAQLIGAFIGTTFIFAIVKLLIPDYDMASLGLGQNHFPVIELVMNKKIIITLLFETVATFIFTLVILGATSKKNPNQAMAGLVIGLTLTAIHIVGIPLTGVSVNPARSIAPAVFSTGIYTADGEKLQDTDPLKELWAFIVGPLVGGALAGIIYREGKRKEISETKVSEEQKSA